MPVGIKAPGETTQFFELGLGQRQRRRRLARPEDLRRANREQLRKSADRDRNEQRRDQRFDEGESTRGMSIHARASVQVADLPL